MSVARPARRCRGRGVGGDGLRPSEMVAAFFALAIAFLVAGAGAGILHAATGWQHGRWLALHLVFVGGVSQLVLGAGQFFAGAFLATDPPGRRLVRLQLAAWNAGALLVAVGVPAGADHVALAGGVLLAVGLSGFVAGLRSLRRQSLQRAPWALRWYEACSAFLGAGILAGVRLATGVAWSPGDLLGTHIALNLAGWFGTAIVGTLHTFFPSLTQTPLLFPRLQGPTFALWLGGTAALAAGYGLQAGPLVVAGWTGLVLAATLLCLNLAASLRVAARPLSLPVRLIAPAQLCLLAGLSIGLADAVSGTAPSAPLEATREALAALLLPGWLGLTVTASLLHLLSVVARVRDLRRSLPAPRPARDGALAALALAGIVVLAAVRAGGPPDLGPPAVGCLVAAYGLLGVLVLRRAARLLRGAPPRI